MNIPELKTDGLPPAAMAEIQKSGAVFEVSESQSNGRKLRAIKVAWGQFDPLFLKPEELELIAANHEPGLYIGAPPPRVDDPNRPLSRGEFEALSAADRLSFVKAGRSLND
jgi:hypothetical protein